MGHQQLKLRDAAKQVEGAGKGRSRAGTTGAEEGVDRERGGG